MANDAGSRRTKVGASPPIRDRARSLDPGYTRLRHGRVEGRIPALKPNYKLCGWIADLEPQQLGQLWGNALPLLAQVHSPDWRNGFDFLDQPVRGNPGLEQYLKWVEEWYEWARQGRSYPLCEVGIEDLRRGRPRDAYDVLAAFRMAVVLIRAADRLIVMKRIRPDSDAGSNNPPIRMLARSLGFKEPKSGPHFLEFIAALGAR